MKRYITAVSLLSAALLAACESPTTSPASAGMAAGGRLSRSTAPVVSVIQGNPTCIDMGFLGDVKQDPTAANGQYTLNAGPGTITFTVNEDNTALASWSSTFPIDRIFMKGGRVGGLAYDYAGGATSGGGEITAVNNDQGARADISHVNFCWYGRFSASVEAAPSYTRTHSWDVTKSATAPASVTSGSSIEVAYTVAVDESFMDSDWTIAGTVKISNAGYAAAGTLNGVEVNVDGVPVTASCPVSLPYEIADNASITCSFSTSVTDAATREVTANVSAAPRFAASAATATVAFGAPTTEIDEAVAMTDTRHALTPDVVTGDYTWNYTLSYGPYTACVPVTLPNNTASFTTNDRNLSESATAGGMVVSVTGCSTDVEELGTAFAHGSSASTFTALSNGAIRRWGWSLGIAAPGSYTYDVYVGAGQNDLTKGTKVGTVTITYAGGTVTASYDLLPGYVVMQQHLYAGTTALPMVTVGKKTVATVAPGQYTVASGLTGPISVIAHAVIGFVQN